MDQTIGPDGYFVDPNHPTNKMTVDEWRAAVARRRLHRYEIGARAGRQKAILDAIAFCAQWQVPIPLWLAAAVSRPAPKRGRGRPPADETDFVRWDMVTECRDRKGDDHIPTTWEATFEAVSEMLRGTPHQGTPETIRASYKRVLKRSRTQPGRYYLPD